MLRTEIKLDINCNVTCPLNASLSLVLYCNTFLDVSGVNSARERKKADRVGTTTCTQSNNSQLKQW